MIRLSHDVSRIYNVIIVKNIGLLRFLHGQTHGRKNRQILIIEKSFCFNKFNLKVFL